MMKGNKTTLLDIHTKLIADHYQMYMNLCDIDQLNSEITLIYNKYGIEYENNAIVLVVEIAPEFILCIFNNQAINNEIFKYMKFLEFHIENAAYPYSDSSAYAYDIDNANGTYGISSKNIDSFMKLYNIHNNFNNNAITYINDYIKNIQDFQNKFGNFLASYGLYINTNILEPSCDNEYYLSTDISFYDEYSTLTLAYDIVNECVMLQYTTREYNTRSIPDIRMLTADKLRRIIHNIPIYQRNLAYSIEMAIISDKSKVVPTKEDALYLRNIFDDLNQQMVNPENTGIVVNILDSIIWSIVPHNKKLQSIIRSAIIWVRLNNIKDFGNYSVTDKFFNVK